MHLYMLNGQKDELNISFLIFNTLVIYLFYYTTMNASCETHGVYWNPFDNEHTKINVKSTMMFELRNIYHYIECKHSI